MPHFACPIETQVGSHVLDLPFPDNHVATVLRANTAKYLPDDEFLAMLHVIRRVVRPGGLLALNDFDAALTQCFPEDPGLLRSFCIAWANMQDMSRGVLRGRGFRR